MWTRKIEDLSTTFWLFTLFGSALIGSSAIYFRFGTPVEAKVLKQTINSYENVMLSPIYEVISENHKGVTAKSKIGTTFGTHQKGSVVQARYLKLFGSIESDLSLKLSAALGVLILLATFGFEFYSRL